MIIRGGEKMSPREVDEALMDHPAVLQAVTFAIPHPMLGEDVAAAVVLREGVAATEQELAGFLSERLAAFKTPRKILFLAEIPQDAPLPSCSASGSRRSWGWASGYAMPRNGESCPFERFKISM